VLGVIASGASIAALFCASTAAALAPRHFAAAYGLPFEVDNTQAHGFVRALGATQRSGRSLYVSLLVAIVPGFG
jgi:hypothetical protein